jgi:hypothetical protein
MRRLFDLQGRRNAKQLRLHQLVCLTVSHRIVLTEQRHSIDAHAAVHMIVLCLCACSTRTYSNATLVCIAGSSRGRGHTFAPSVVEDDEAYIDFHDLSYAVLKAAVE